MFEMISIGDTSQNIFLEMEPENAHLHQIRNESCQICFNYADKIPVKSLHDTMGGNSANAAVSFARLGLSSALYTHLGGDFQGERILKELEHNQVAQDYVVVDHKLATNYSTVINLNAERTILIYHIHRHYHLPKLEPCKWLYFSSMSNGFEIVVPDLLEYIKEQHANLVYQPGTFQLKFGAEHSASILKHAKLLVVNKEEAELYLERKPTDDFRSLLDGILELGPEIALITDGPKGAYVSDGKQYLYLGIIEEAPRIEATGAGDAFASAFTAALAAGQDLNEAMRFGQAQASSVIQFVGAQAGLLTHDQITKLLQAHPELQTTSIPK